MHHLESMALTCIEENCRKNGIVAAKQGPKSIQNGQIHEEYIHIWPRDAALVALELTKINKLAGELQINAICNLPTINGILFQRYELNGSPDEFAWCNEQGKHQLDQDALKLFAASKSKAGNKSKMYTSFLSLLEKVREKEKSTDIWEQKQGYFLYTTTALILGLKAGEEMFGSTIESKELISNLKKSIEAFYCTKKHSFIKSPLEQESTLDLEVVLALNLLLENDIFSGSKFILKCINTLQAVERELARPVCDVSIPIRFKDDFWNGEAVGENGTGRPWPMGCAMISQCYSQIARKAQNLNNFLIQAFAVEKAKFWLLQFENCPNIHLFPEQVDFDGSIPKTAPKNLTWCAAEYLKAKRLVKESEN